MPDIHHKFHVNASPHQVFETFTRSEGLNSWWTLQSSGEPLKGNIYNFYFGPAYDWLAEVIHVIPDQELTWRMTRAMDDWMETEVDSDLPRKVRVQLFGFFIPAGKNCQTTIPSQIFVGDSC